MTAQDPVDTLLGLIDKLRIAAWQINAHLEQFGSPYIYDLFDQEYPFNEEFGDLCFALNDWHHEINTKREA
jgi:hypothetical protein